MEHNHEAGQPPRPAYLPEVTQEVNSAAVRDAMEMGAQEHLFAVGQRLADTQPHLNFMIEDLLKRTETRKEQEFTLEAAFMVFELLDRAAEAKAMNANFPTGPSPE